MKYDPFITTRAILETVDSVRVALEATISHTEDHMTSAEHSVLLHRPNTRKAISPIKSSVLTRNKELADKHGSSLESWSLLKRFSVPVIMSTVAPPNISSGTSRISTAAAISGQSAAMEMIMHAKNKFQRAGVTQTANGAMRVIETLQSEDGAELFDIDLRARLILLELDRVGEARDNELLDSPVLHMSHQRFEKRILEQVSFTPYSSPSHLLFF